MLSLVIGSLLILTGLSFAQAIVVIVIGNAASYLLLGFMSLAGPQTGTSQLTVSRAPFGYNWNRFNAFFNWLVLLGYEVADLAIVVLAFVAVFGKAGVADSTGLKIFIILLTAAIQLPLPLYGYALVSKMMRPLSVLLGAFFVVMACLLPSRVHPNALNLSASSYGNRQHDQGERSPRFRALVRVGGPGGVTGAALGLARV